MSALAIKVSGPSSAASLATWYTNMYVREHKSNRMLSLIVAPSGLDRLVISLKGSKWWVALGDYTKGAGVVITLKRR